MTKTTGVPFVQALAFKDLAGMVGATIHVRLARTNTIGEPMLAVIGSGRTAVQGRGIVVVTIPSHSPTKPLLTFPRIAKRLRASLLVIAGHAFIGCKALIPALAVHTSLGNTRSVTLGKFTVQIVGARLGAIDVGVVKALVQRGMTDIVRTRVGVRADDGCVSTTCCRITEVIGAVVPIVAVDAIVVTTNRGIAPIHGARVIIVTGDRCVHAAIGWITDVNGTEASIIAINNTVDAETRLRITRIIGASVVVVARFVGKDTTIGGIAGIDRTVVGVVTFQDCIVTVAIIRVARVCGARVLIIAFGLRHATINGVGIAQVERANVVIVTVQ